MFRLILVAAILTATGCATVPPHQQINFEGNIALESQNYQLAREKYKGALAEAEKSKDLQYSVIAMYGLARANGYLCNFKEAEEWFKKSISLRENLPDSNTAYLSQNILEFARLYVAQKKWKEATAQFERAIPLLESLDIEKRDPIGYANVLEDYKSSLQFSGNMKEAEKIKQKIEYLRSAYSSRRASFKTKPYPENCALN